MNKIEKKSTGFIDPVAKVVEQVGLLQKLMSSVLKEGEHYSKIFEGNEKFVLLKPGAEKIALMFKMFPRFEIEKTDLENGHREYYVKCILYHRDSGVVIGEGVGSCSTMESKYRYRWDDTGNPVPKKYWETKDQMLIGGNSYTVRKSGKEWRIYRKVEHDNPADYYNVVLKMAKKRAYVDAVITNTAASDFFVQDIDDIEENENNYNPNGNSVSYEKGKEENGKENKVGKDNGVEKEKALKTMEDLQRELHNEMMLYFGSQEGIAEFLEKMTGGKGYKKIESVYDIKTIKQLNYIKGQFRKLSGSGK